MSGFLQALSRHATFMDELTSAGSVKKGGGGVAGMRSLALLPGGRDTESGTRTHGHDPKVPA